MKNIFLTLFIIFGSITASQAIPPLFGPNGSLSMWKCSWNDDLDISVDGDNCHFERSMTCTHWLWGSRTNGYEWDRPCNTNGIENNDDTPFDCPCGIGVEAHFLH